MYFYWNIDITSNNKGETYALYQGVQLAKTNFQFLLLFFLSKKGEDLVYITSANLQSLIMSPTVPPTMRKPIQLA